MSLQGCSEQRAMEVLRRTGPLVRLRLLRRALRLNPNLAPVPPLHPLRHSHSFSESSSRYGVGLRKIQEKGTMRREHPLPIQQFVWYCGRKKWELTRNLNKVILVLKKKSQPLFCAHPDVFPTTLTRICSLRELSWRAAYTSRWLRHVSRNGMFPFL